MQCNAKKNTHVNFIALLRRGAHLEQFQQLFIFLYFVKN
jgi:hypothetical protein